MIDLRPVPLRGPLFAEIVAALARVQHQLFLELLISVPFVFDPTSSDTSAYDDYELLQTIENDQFKTLRILERLARRVADSPTGIICSRKPGEGCGVCRSCAIWESRRNDAKTVADAASDTLLYWNVARMLPCRDCGIWLVDEDASTIPYHVMTFHREQYERRLYSFRDVG